MDFVNFASQVLLVYDKSEKILSFDWNEFVAIIMF